MIDRQRLLDAAALIEHAIRHADTTETKCDACGVMHKRNWTETQGAKELGSVIKKLRTWAHRVEKHEAKKAKRGTR